MFNGMPLQKTMNGGMRWYLFENSGQNPPLQFLEPRLGGFNQTNVARWLRQNAVVIVPQVLARARTAEAFQIGEPIQFVRLEFQPGR